MVNILTRFTLTDEAKAAIAAHEDWHLIEQADYQPEQAGTIDVILGFDAAVQAIIDGPNRVRFIQTVSAGVNSLPLAQLAAQDILVANTSGIHAEAIGQYVLGGLLSLARGIVPQPTTWDHAERRARQYSLEGQRAVVFGTGHIGQVIAKHLIEFGVKVIGVNETGAATAPFADVVDNQGAVAEAAEADIVLNALPLTPSTEHLYDADFFAALKNQPVFVNIGRGESVAEPALIKALQAGQVRAALLDVFEVEPLPEASPLWTMPNVVMTPHIAGTPAHLQEAVTDIFMVNLNQFGQDGTIVKNQVNLTRGY